MRTSHTALPVPMPRRLIALALSAGLAVTLASCGSNDTSTVGAGSNSPSVAATTNSIAAVHNDADVAFINDMSPHHTGAIKMAELATTRAASQQVKDLAAKIAAAQGPEQQLMAAMAEAWGVAPPATDGAMHAAMPMAGAMPSESPSGMGRSGDPMLARLDGAAFDRAFLTQMIAHHQGALPMSQAELDNGSNPAAKKLAKSIIAAQTAEIVQMQRMLTSS